jgi:hypothetical protein
LKLQKGEFMPTERALSLQAELQGYSVLLSVASARVQAFGAGMNQGQLALKL